MSGLPTAVAEDTQERIVAAALERFRHYGYGKTTMAEIARDCGMSAGNLYRYFESKSDIGAAVSSAWFGELQAAARQAVAQPAQGAHQKLESLVLATARFTLETCETSPRIQEMVDFLCEERRDLLEAHLHTLMEITTEVIGEGNAAGEFAVKDVASASRAFQIASAHFQYPPLVTLMDEETLVRECHAVVGLLVEGLGAR